jgi:hypothetical protein
MKLTRLQYKILKVWLRYHDAGYGLGQWLRTCWKSWLLLSVMGAWAYYFAVPVSPAFGWGYFGLCLGAFLRDIGYYQVAQRNWPVTNKVIDWKLAAELVELHEKDKVQN